MEPYYCAKKKVQHQPEREDLQLSICTAVYFSANDFIISLIFEDTITDMMMMILN